MASCVLKPACRGALQGLFSCLWLKQFRLPVFSFIGRRSTRDSVDRASTMSRRCLFASCVLTPACRAASAELFLHLHLPAPSAELFLHLRQKFGSRQIRRKFGKLGIKFADSATVRQIRQKFGRFGKSSADSAKVRQIRQKFSRLYFSCRAYSHPPNFQKS